MPAVLIDTNLLLLLIVGEADPKYIAAHKRIRKNYSEDDFDLLRTIIGEYDDMVVIPHVLAEVSSLARMIDNPALDRIQLVLCRLVDDVDEVIIESSAACRRSELLSKGLTDTVILEACARGTLDGMSIELLTADEPLFNAASSLGYLAELW